MQGDRKGKTSGDVQMRLFRWFLSKLNKFEIGNGSGHHDSTFFIRYDLLKTPWFSVYLHEFLRSDEDRCLHDHPWPFVTIILRGGYWEEIKAPFYLQKEGCRPLTISRWRRPGYIGRYPAEHAHRIELEPSKPKPWSLVFVGRKQRAWGFHGPQGWKAWTPGEQNPVCGPQ